MVRPRTSKVCRSRVEIPIISIVNQNMVDGKMISNDSIDNVPVIDLEAANEDDLVKQIASACESYGFFQVHHHGIPKEIVDNFRQACKRYFDLPLDVKQRWKRHSGNARGFFDDELTKQRRDWKQCLDVGVPGSRHWSIPDEDPSNHCMDGWNQLPTDEELSRFRESVTIYFDACADLSHRLTVLMAKGVVKGGENDQFVQHLLSNHTSYLRLNYYPMCDSDETPPPLGISPHKDAGFLTVLLQDDDCHSLQVWKDGQWLTVHPEPDTFTINTGDMAQIWSNGAYQAPLHRVLANKDSVRYSAPFFYNPSYSSWVKPAVTSCGRYFPVLWGYFRAVRFAGDYTDFGAEIQIEDFEVQNDDGQQSSHLAKQELFASCVSYDKPFNVDQFRHLLKPKPEGLQETQPAGQM